MKIACSPEIFSELAFLKAPYQVEAVNLNSFRLARKIKDFDLLVISWPSSGPLFWLRVGLILARSQKLAIFGNLQETDFKLSYLDTKLLLRARRIIYPNLESVRHGSLSPIYWKAPEKFREIPYGVNLEEYVPKDSFRPSENAVVEKFKAIINFVTKKVIKKDRLNILVAGKNPEEWRDIFTPERVGGRIIYFNGQEEETIKRVKSYQEGDVLVIPENEEGKTAQEIIEALACGLVVVAPRGGRLNNIFDHDKQGLFFKPKDSKDLLEKIAVLCGDEEKREAMALAARKLAENHYGKKQREDKINQIIKELEK